MNKQNSNHTHKMFETEFLSSFQTKTYYLLVYLINLLANECNRKVLENAKILISFSKSRKICFENSLFPKNLEHA